MLGVAQDHEARGRDVAEPLGEQVAPVEPFEHVVVETLESQQRVETQSGRAGLGVCGQADRPAQVGGLQRQVAAEPPAQPGGGRPAQRLAGRAVERGVEGIRSGPARRRGNSSTRRSVIARHLARAFLRLEQLGQDRGGLGLERPGFRPARPERERPSPGQPPGPFGPELGHLAGQLGRERLAVAVPERQARLAAPPSRVDRAEPSRRRNSRLRPSSTNRSPGTSRSA